MTDPNSRKKLKYESPILVPLGLLARGSGACTAGSGDTDTCTAGGLALTACTAGNSAHAGCTAGSLVGT
ncbi:MAG: hypothetical protein HQM09_18250 [Candidatus Riflebacteria bacterium]|nr:hypothetical protein [Candidatus Riflebacteria bacterium]